MKHPYSEPNNSKEDRLYKARELLKSYNLVHPALGTITLYKLLRRGNARSLLTLEMFSSIEPVTVCYLVCKHEVPAEQFFAAVTLVTEWGYKPHMRSLTWGSVTEYKRDYSAGKVIMINGKDGLKRKVEI